MAADLSSAIKIAAGEIGNYESPPNSNKQKYGEWYGWNGVAWCAIFVSWILGHSGDAWYRFASVASSVARAKRDGRQTFTPKPGMVACKLYTETKGHTGYVEHVPGDGTVITIEGNTSGSNNRDGGSVMRRRRSISWWNAGFITIEYTSNQPTIPPAAGAKCYDIHPTLKNGDVGRGVNHLQYMLNRTGSGIAGDGDFGQATENALRNFQTWAKIESDGVCGPVTWKTLHKHVDGLTI